jgi:hypothetical protein
VVQAYNPSYSGGRDQEDHSSKPAQANSSRDLTLRKPITKKKKKKKRLVEWLKVEALSSNPSTGKKEKEKRNTKQNFTGIKKKSL